VVENAPAWVAPAPRLKPREFQRIRELAHRKFGLNLRPGKEELVVARLGKKLREGQFASFQDYYDFVVADRTGEELINLIDALTTNHTSFLRESAHFDFFGRQVMPELSNRRRIDVWCAAAATGEEPYTICLTILNSLGGRSSTAARVLATDISTRALGMAREGVYPEDRLRDVPAEWKGRYFQKGQRTATGYYRVAPQVKSMVEFRRLNLIDDYVHSGKFPVIFCRNVMIYFDPKTKEEVISRLLKWLEPGGYLFVGHSEGLVGQQKTLRHVGPAIYQYRPELAARPTERAVS